MDMTEEQIKEIAAEAAEAAVSKLFLSLGVDSSDPQAVIGMQKDFAHLRSWRESVESVRNKSLMTAVGVIITGIIGAIYWSIQNGGHIK